MTELKAHYDTDKFPSVDEKLVVRDNANLKTASYARHYFANVTSVDKYVGLVLDELEKMGELDNTIVPFTSDHGEMLGSHGRKGKGVVNTESVAIPFIVHWPKGLDEQITDLMIGAPDILPTLLGLTNMQKAIPIEVQGRDYSDLLFNPNSTKVKKPESVFLMNRGWKGVRTDRYTLYLGKGNKKKDNFVAYIFDNEKDPYQQHQIGLEENKALSESLLKMLAQHLKEANDEWYQKKLHADLIPYN
jgi:arylsulfatase A-like enzyme